MSKRPQGVAVCTQRSQQPRSNHALMRKLSACWLFIICLSSRFSLVDCHEDAIHKVVKLLTELVDEKVVKLFV